MTAPPPPLPPLPPFACHAWVRAVQLKHVRVAATGRIIYVVRGCPTLPSRCPFCGLGFYLDGNAKGKTPILSEWGWGHRNAVEEAQQ